VACDRWALKKFAGTQKKSLRKALDAYVGLLGMDYIDKDRKVQILKSVLEIDAGRFGNKRAKALLEQFENGSEKDANLVITATTMAAVSAASALISLSTQTIFGMRNQWAKGKVSEKTAARMQILEHASRAAVAKYITTYLYTGTTALGNRVRDRQQLQSDVFGVMAANGVWDDNNIFTKNWSKKNADDFFKKYGWAREEINRLADEYWNAQKPQLVAQGYGDGEDAPTSVNWLFWGVAGIIAVIVLAKIIPSKNVG
jgi:hypothetical protein